ncbi:MAG: ferrochelatase [Actinobacteria bacterium]|nr:ferrochelatase [Actinomycetota bacterium]
MTTQPSHGAFDDSAGSYDAVLYLSFGGPEGPEDVMPFLENVTRGRGVSEKQLAEVAEHYLAFGGVSPINSQNRAVIAALEEALAAAGLDLPVYWGNRNWKPYVAEALQLMADDGVRHAICFVSSAFSSYSGCRQYREDLAAASAEVPGAPAIDKLRVFFNHPGFVAPVTEKVAAALMEIPAARRGDAHLAFTAHSIPASMAETSSYVTQLRETCRLVDEATGGNAWELIFQSRSGPPHIPWLEPDISEHLEKLAADGVADVVVVPVGFVSDHLEVLFDLDVEAADTAATAGINMVRAGTVGIHPVYIEMIVGLIRERMSDRPERACLGTLPPSHDICARDCCPGPMLKPALAEL